MGITALISSYLMSNIILQCEQKTKRLDEQKTSLENKGEIYK